MSVSTPTLEAEAVEVITAVRSAFADVLSALPLPCRRAADVARILRLPRKLGWQVFKVATSPDPFTAAQHLPSPAGVTSLLKAAAAQGVSPAILERARIAASRVDSLVRIHAGDRSSLELMIDSFAGERHDTQEEVHRRNAFKSNSYIFGSQLRTRLVLHLLKAGSDPARVDVAIVNGLYGLRRLRSDARRLLFSTGVRDALDSNGKQTNRAALTPQDHAPDAGPTMPLMMDFCSQPLPRLQAQPPRDGYIDFELAEWPIGETGAVTMVSGELFYNFASRYSRPGDARGNLVAHINRPCEILVHDVMVHRDLWPQFTPRALIYGELDRVTRAQTMRRDDDLLPLRVQIDELGQGIDSAASPDVPSYLDLLRTSFASLQWDPAEFRFFRLRLAYPILPSAVVVQFDLPEH